jgi:hypothetical protein
MWVKGRESRAGLGSCELGKRSWLKMGALPENGTIYKPHLRRLFTVSGRFEVREEEIVTSVPLLYWAATKVS